MINQLMIIKLVRLWIKKSDWVPGDIESSSYELRSALIEGESLVSLLTIHYKPSVAVESVS